MAAGALTSVYYLRAGTQAAGAALLERAGSGGYVWPRRNGWVPLVLRGAERDGFLVAALGDGDLLLRYFAAAGKGWSFELLSRKKCFMRYARFFGPPERIERELVDENLPILARLASEHGMPGRTGASDAELRVLLLSALFAPPSAKRRFSDLLGLVPCEGLFYDELPSDILERVPGTVRVGARSARRTGRGRPA